MIDYVPRGPLSAARRAVLSQRAIARAPDLTGNVYGRLTVRGRAPYQANRPALWICDCSCGEQAMIRPSSLRSGRTRSCGCLRSETSWARMAERMRGLATRAA